MNTRTVALLTLAVTAAAWASQAIAQDRADIDRSQIIGNRELPKVLYIVPWKKPAPDGLSGRPVQSVLDEALAPIDRDVFRRQMHYQAQTQAQAAPKPPAPAGTTAPAPRTDSPPPASQEKVK